MSDLVALGVVCAVALVVAVLADRRRAAVRAARSGGSGQAHVAAGGIGGRASRGEVMTSPVGLPCIAFGIVLVRDVGADDDGPVTRYRVTHRGGWTEGLVVEAHDGRTIVVERGRVSVEGPSHAIVRGDAPAEAHRVRAYTERAGVAGSALGVETRLTIGDEVTLLAEQVVPGDPGAAAPFRARTQPWKATGNVRVVLSQPHALWFSDDAAELP